MAQMTPEMELFCTRWLAPEAIPIACRPHFYNLSFRHRVVFLMETPLERSLPARSPVVRYVEACRRHLRDWFRAANTADIWTEIACALPPSILGTELTSCEDLLDSVYFTDCVKCESPEKKDLRHHRSHSASCLRDEFTLLERPILFISVGGTAWRTIRDLVGPLSAVGWHYQNLNHGLPGPDTDIMEAHGILFENRAMSRFVIPVTFPGGRVNALRNSYIDYLKEGLAALEAMGYSAS